MPSTRDIRRRIKSVKNTAQITKAMQMVASAKMRKAQLAALAGRPYTDLMNQVLSEVTSGLDAFRHPLTVARPVRKRGVILVSTDKGLCGSLNTNLLREAGRFDKDTTVYIAAGKKGGLFVARVRRQLAAEFHYKDTPLFSEARAISKFAQELFTKGEVDAVDILYTNFVSTLVQQPKTVPFLPIAKIMPATAGVNAPAAEPLAASGTSYEFEPSAEEVLGELLPHYLNFKVYQVLLEAKASEHSSRMVAMKSATDNANQLIKDLTLEYNKLRQANITKELLEITTAQMAMG
jgi:F-type H+-transporting ATPase subunit gamma